MKRTTYILAGMLLAGLVVMGSIQFYLSTCAIRWEDSFMRIDGEQKTVQLPQCRVVKLYAKGGVIRTEMKNGSTEVSRIISFEEAPITVQSTDSANGSFSFANGLEEHLTMSTQGDTLCIAFDFSKEKCDDKFKDEQWVRLRTAGMTLRIPANVQRVMGDMYNLKTTYRGFSRDSLFINTCGTAVVEESRFVSLHAETRSLFLASGEVRDLYLDLDDISDWQVNVETFHIDTEHLSGSSEHRNEVQKGECRQVLWTPKSEGASLNLKLRQAAKVEIEQ